MSRAGRHQVTTWSNPGVAAFQVDAGFRRELLEAWGDRKFAVFLKKTRRGVGKPVLVFERPVSSEEHPIFHSLRSHTMDKRAKNKIEERVGKFGRYWVVPNVVRKCSFFSSTSKMNCPSWSLPAGSPKIGGSCPAAGAMLDVKEFDPKLHANSVRALERLTGTAVRQGGERSQFVCDSCYAGKGSYADANIQLFQLIRLWWQEGALAEGSFADAMTEAVAANAAALKRSRSRAESHDFFRIHDSGDFTGVAAIKGWHEVARRLPGIRFWAPTRVWPYFAQQLADGCPPNLAIRPSALNFHDGPPQVPGLAAGSMASMAPAEGVWECPAYKATDVDGKPSHTCLDSINPFGKRGCRVCWGTTPAKKIDVSHVPVSYHLH